MDKKEQIAQKIVKHFPAFITPNLLTLLRFSLLPLIIYLIVTGRYALALALFIIAFILDLLDGPLARQRQQTTEFGALLDPLADKMLFLTVLFLVTYQTLPHLLIFTILFLEIIIIFIAGVLAPLARFLKFQIKIGANRFGKYKMFLQFIAIIMIMIAPQNQIIINIATGLFLIAILFSAISILDHCRHIKR
jgi:cardiolipin synthase